MKLISIKLCNFRQFYGKTPEINLASGEKNTTIIHGNNGAGKTTLLNAFTWVLYEQFTAAFTSPELLINKQAITEVDTGVSVECWVEIYFEHENKRYQVKRKCYACRDRDGKIQYSQNQYFMLVAGDDGRWYPPLQQPDEIINRILPESLHHYFFFDGEHIDRIFRQANRNHIAEDTKELLGIKVLDRSIEHLKKAKRTLQDELKAIGDNQTKQLLQEHSNLLKESDRLQQYQRDIVTQLTLKQAEKKQLSQRLLELSGAEELKQLKDKLEAQERATRHHLLEAKNRLKQSLSSRGYLFFLCNIIEKFDVLMADLRQRGELPSGIKQPFVQQLLESQQCICGRELIIGTKAYDQVQERLNQAGMADVEEAAIRLESQVSNLAQQTGDLWQEIDTEQTKINQWRTELSSLESDIDKISHKFRHFPDEDIKVLQQNLDEIDDGIRELILEQGANQQQITAISKEIETIDKQLVRQKLKEEKQNLAQRRIAATQEASDRLTDVRTRLEKQFRLSLEKRVQEIFSSISFTPYLPHLNKDYELTLIENTSGVAIPVAASTGENQILSLSFIGGIIDRVREWSQKNTLMGPDTSTFPIVMDSPFGSLDEIYRRQVAKSIPQLANQLVILATKTQWRTEVAEETERFIGQQYVLVYHSPKPNCQEDFIELNGVKYPLVKRSLSNFEYTEILPVE